MADQYEQSGVAETTDRGLFGFGGKKEENEPHEEALSSEFTEKVQVSEEPEKKHEGLLEKLHRSNSSSSSSSDEEEEVEGGGEKKKKKKLKEKIKNKISGDDHKKEEEKKGEEYHHHEADTSVPVEKIDEPASEEKKGFLDKIKEKFPGGPKKTEESAPVAPAPPPPAPAPAPPAAAPEYATTAAHDGEAKEKKGFLEKIKEKIPGYNSKPEDEKEKEKEKGAASY